jgi:hypothetical protein
VNISKNKNGETQTSPDFNKLNTGNASKEFMDEESNLSHLF